MREELAGMPSPTSPSVHPHMAFLNEEEDEASGGREASEPGTRWPGSL
jgi:hypothetical protein